MTTAADLYQRMVEMAHANTECFGELVKVAGLDPQHDFQRSLLTCDLRNEDLGAYDFSGARFLWCDLRGADLTHTRGVTWKMLATAKWDTDTRLPMALTGSIDPEDGSLAANSEVSFLKAVANHACAPPEVCGDLAGNADTSIRSAVASNANTPLQYLDILAKDYSVSVRASVARNAATPPELLSALIQSGNLEVQCAVAENPNTPPEILKKLLSYSDNITDQHYAAIRRSVAINPNTPVEELTRLSGDAYASVRKSVASNRTTPRDILASLARDNDSTVSKAAQDSFVEISAKNLVDTAITEGGRAKPPSLKRVLSDLAGSTDGSLRKAVASNLGTPNAVLAKLAYDNDYSVRKAVAGNSQVSCSLLHFLAKDADVEVRMAVAQSKEADVEILTELARSTSSVREAVAGNIATPEWLLIELARDGDVPTRRAVAKNPTISKKVCATLALDENPSVLWALREHRLRRPL